MSPLNENANGKTYVWPPPTLEDWMLEVETEAPPPWYIDGILPYDGVCVISAQPKTMKTFFAMQLSRILSSGHTCTEGLPLAADFKPVKIWFAEWEGSRGVNYDHWKMLENGTDWKANRRNIFWSHRPYGWTLSDPACVEEAQEFIQKQEISVVFVNTFAESRGGRGDENDERTIHEAHDALRSLQTVTLNKKGTVVYVHHCRKLSDEEDDNIAQDVRGSSAVAGGYDHHLGFRKPPKQQGLYLITNGKGDYDRYFSVNWKIDKKEKYCATLDLKEWKISEPEYFTASRLGAWVDKLSPKLSYTEKALRDLWRAPQQVVDKIAGQLLAVGTLEKKPRGYALLGGGDRDDRKTEENQ